MYRAVDGVTGAVVALKTLNAITAEQVVLLKNEFRSLQGLQHPNLVQMGELVEEGGQLSLSMEFVQGVDFVSHVTDQRTRRFDDARLRASLRQLASALGALHRANIVHRDIKPSNVLVTSSGRVVVLDFGLALRPESSRPKDDEGIVGTVLFMAPEQAAGETIGPPADWYAVGVMLFLALTGRHPFEGPMADVLGQKVTQPAPSPRAFAHDLPDDLVAFCERLLLTDAAARPTHEEVIESLGLTSEAPRALEPTTLIGRTRELAWLDAALRSVLGGEPVTAAVYGESGVGKSLLLRTFVERLERQQPEVLCLFSRCYERSSVPFKAFDGATERLAGVLEATSAAKLAPWLSEHAGILPRLFPELGLVAELARRAGSVVVEDAKEARRHAFEALRRLLAGLASTRPVLLVIDDLQWADADSLGLLRALVAPPDPPPLLLLCTLRVGSETLRKGQQLVVDFARGARSLVLSRLSLDETTLFVGEQQRREGAPPLDPGEVAELARETGGNPMLLMELLHERKEGAQGGHGRLGDILAARLEQLAPAALRLLKVVCVAGQPVDERAAAEAAAVLGTELLSALPQLRNERFAQTRGGDRGGVYLEPYHDRVREIVVAALPEDERRGWHAKLALALERSSQAVEPEMLATQWLESGAPQRALDYVMRAAEKAKASFAFDRAASFVAKALELATDPTQQVRLRLALADALTQAGRGPAAAQACLAAAADASPADALELRRRAGEQFLISGHLKGGLTTLNEVLQGFGMRLAPTTVHAIINILLLRLWIRLRGLRMAKRAPGEVSVWELQRADVCWSTSAGLGVVDNIRGAEFAARNLLVSMRAGDALRYHRALLTQSCFLVGPGDHGSRKRARRMLERVRQAAESGESPYLTAAFELVAGWQAYFSGEFRTGRARCLRSRQMFDEQGSGARWERDTGVYWGLCSAVFLGDLPAVARALPRYLQDAEDRGDLFFETLLRIGHTSVHWLANDEPDALDAAVQSVLSRWPTDRYLIQHMYGLWTTTMIDLYTGGGARSVRAYEEQWPSLKRGVHLRVQLSKLRVLQMRASAHLGAAESLSDPGPSAEKARTDARAMMATRSGWADGWAHLLLAGVSHLERRQDRARSHLERAVEDLDRAGLALHAAAARARLGALRGGSAGEALRAQGMAEIAECGVKVPERFLRVLAPGFAEPAG